MQLYAFNREKQLVSATHAVKQQNYHCAECEGVVRLRGGVHRQSHFYHLKHSNSCRQSQKSLVHIQVQKHLQQLLPEGDCILEQRFTEINRIADVVWEPNKLIFEVQCSGITAEEVECRNVDYLKLGYQVVWVLHDNRFNKWKVSAAERFLLGSPHYYTNIDKKGRGHIYDQIDVIHKGVRMNIQKPLIIDPTKPKWIPENQSNFTEDVPRILAMRLLKWPLYFSQDLMDCCRYPDQKLKQALQKAIDFERGLISEDNGKFLTSIKYLLYRYIARPYLLVFQVLLEKACR